MWPFTRRVSTRREQHGLLDLLDGDLLPESRLLRVFSGQAPLADYSQLDTLAREGYRGSAVFRACVDEIAQSVSEPRLVVERAKPKGQWEEVIPGATGPSTAGRELLELLANPGGDRKMSSTELRQRVVQQDKIFGNSFLWKRRFQGSGRIGALQVLPVPYIKPQRLTASDKVTKLEYTPEGSDLLTTQPRIIDAADVIHRRSPDPLDAFWGIPQGLSAAREMDLDHRAVDYLRTFFANGGTPSGLLTLKGKVADPERKRIKMQWLEEFTGKRRHSTAVLDQDASYESIGTRPDHLKLGESVFDVSESRVCCLPGTEIVTIRGLVPIEEIRVGDRVLSHTGRWRRVTKTFQNPVHDQAFEIQAKGFDPLRVTGNHPVLSAVYTQSRAHKKALQGTDWKAARDLRPRGIRGGFDALVLPQIADEGQQMLRLSDHIRGKRFAVREEGGQLVHAHPMAAPLPAQVPMSKALGRILGLYLAEGSTGGGKLQFYLGAHERHLRRLLIRDLQAVFGLESKEVATTQGVVAVNCQSAMLVELFACGTARTKKLPEWAWQGGREFLSSVLRGWLAGDGHKSELTRRGTTVSRDLAWQMRLIAIACGFEAGLMQAKLGTGGCINGRLIRANYPANVVSWKARRTRGYGSFTMESCGMTAAVQRKEPIPYLGDVYNLEVEEDESYTTTGGVVHNCSVFGVPPIIIGVRLGIIRGTYSNYASARTSFWNETLRPLYTSLDEDLTLQLAHDFGIPGEYRIRHDLSDVRDLQESTEILWKRALDAYDRGLVTRDEARRIVNLHCDGGGEHYKVKTTDAPAAKPDEIPQGAPKPVPAPGAPAAKPTKLSLLEASSG